MLADAYLALGDKSYLPMIAEKIIAKYRADVAAGIVVAAERQAAATSDQPLQRLFESFGHVFVFYSTRGPVLANANWNYLVVTKDGPLYFRDGSEYYSYFGEKADFSDVQDEAEQVRIIEANAEALHELNRRFGTFS